MIGQLTDPEYWEKYRVSSYVETYAPADGVNRDIYSDDCWYLAFRYQQGTVGSSVTLKFSAGYTIVLNAQFPLFELTGFPYVKRDDIITVTAFSGTCILNVVKHKLVPNVEKPTIRRRK